MEKLNVNKLVQFPIFDSHMHIVDPRFPLIPNQGYLPEIFTVEDYRARTAPFDIIGGAVVSGSFQGEDQNYLLDALERLGSGFVGVTQLPVTVPDQEILRLNAAGVRAVRFNFRRGGADVLEKLEALARRVYDLAGWHAELYIDSKYLAELAPLLTALPRVCIDHLGLSRAGFNDLLRLVERGVYVKATGFGRVDFDVPQALKAIADVNPAALVFATDLPCPRAPRPFQDSDVELVLEALGESLARRVFYENALGLYHSDTWVNRT